MKRFLTFFLAILVLLMSIGCDSKKKESENIKIKSDKIDFINCSENAVLENDNFKLVVVKDTSEMQLYDKLHNCNYSSRALASDNNNDKTNSEFLLKYYDSQSIEYFINSYQSSVVNKSFEIQTAKDTIRVKYSLNKNSEDYFYPNVLSVQTFESICSKLSNVEASQLKRYYQLLKTSSNTKQIKAYKEKYSYLKKHDMYISYDNMMKDDKRKLASLISKANYTNKQYSEDIKEFNIDISKLNLSPSFEVTIDYLLTENGVKVSCPLDEIVNGNTSYVLQQVLLMPGFGAVNLNNDITLVLADGSGSVSKMSEHPDVSFEKKIYGNNEVVQIENTTTLSQSYRLPVYGVTTQQGSYLSIVSENAASASIIAESQGNKNKSNMISTAFNYVDKDKISVRSGSNLEALNYYSSKSLKGKAEIEYVFCQNQSTDMDLALKYREYLINKKIISENIERKNLLIEFTGLTTIDKQFAGKTYNEKVVLSTLSDIYSELNDLYKKGLNKIDVRLIGIGKDGKYNGFSNDFTIDKKVGTKEELDKLSELIGKHNGILYLENDVTYSYNNHLFDNASINKDVSKKIGGAKAYKMQYDLVKLNYDNNIQPRYIVSPSSYLNFFSKYIKKLNNSINTSNIGISWSNGGRVINSNYDTNNTYDRTDSLIATENVFKYISDKYPCLTNGGNEYSFPFSGFLCNIPLFSSQEQIETNDSLFYQVVINGCKNYTGESINTSVYSDKVFLRSVETGASLYYSVITNDKAYAKLDATKDTDIFPCSIKSISQDILNNTKNIDDINSKIKNSNIINHKMIKKDIYRTDYSNGKYIVVNYSSNDFEYNNVLVKSNNFCVVEEQK